MKKFPWSFFKNKYLLSSVIFLLWLAFFDQNDFFTQFRLAAKLKELKKDQLYYSRQIAQDKKALKDLMSDNRNLERFAREHYLMKKDNEEVFVFVDEEKKK